MSERESHQPQNTEPERPHLTVEQAGTKFEVFPTGLRMSGTGFRLDVTGEGFTPQVSPDRVVFTGTGADNSHLTLGARQDGAVIFRIDPHVSASPQEAHQPALPGETNQPVPTLGIDRSDRPSAAPQTPPPPPVDSSRDTTSGVDEVADHPGRSEKERGERVSLTGRYLYDPKFRQTASGTLVGSFKLAVHDEDGRTTAHRIVAYHRLAATLRQQLADSGRLTGRETVVTGYRHSSPKRDHTGAPILKDGQPVIETRINAVAIVNPGS